MSLKIKGNACVWKEAKTGESLDHVSVTLKESEWKCWGQCRIRRWEYIWVASGVIWLDSLRIFRRGERNSFGDVLSGVRNNTTE